MATSGGVVPPQEKTEDPTPKRLREARKKGQVSKSQDLEHVLVLLAAFSAIALSIPFMSSEVQRLMKFVFASITKSEFVVTDLYDLGRIAFVSMIKVSAPVLITTVVVAAVVGFLQVGPVFSLESLQPDTKRLNVIENLKNMFKAKALFELVKNIFKLVVIFYIAYRVVMKVLDAFVLTATTSIEGATHLGGHILMKFLIEFFVLFLVLGLLDFLFQRKEYLKNLRMTKEEVKREYKEDEGDPLIKGHRRQLHMEMAMGDTRQNVRTADVVVTNPTHLAVALRYSKTEMGAPEIVAKGQRLYAEFIRELAKEYDVPIVRNIPLAWALIELEIGDEVPERLYLAVAEILTYVYRLKEEGQDHQS